MSHASSRAVILAVRNFVCEGVLGGHENETVMWVIHNIIREAWANNKVWFGYMQVSIASITLKYEYYNLRLGVCMHINALCVF